MGFVKTSDTVFGSILISPRGRICLVKGSKTQKWSLPKGHPNPGETAFQCAARETLEETGITIPWQTHRPLKLAIGWYYIIFVPEEYMASCEDAGEISEVGWFSTDAIRTLLVNIDINAFLKKLNKEPEENELPVWQLVRRRCRGYGFSQRSQVCNQSCPIVVQS